MLRTLEIKASNVEAALWNGPPKATIGLLTYALSTITSPAFSTVTIFYHHNDFCRTGIPYILFHMTPTDRAKTIAMRHSRLFEVVHGMYTVRNFRLVLCAEVFDGEGAYTLQVLKEIVAAERAKNELGYLPPDIQYHLRTI